MLDEDKAVLVRGLVLPEEGAPTKISVQDIVPLEVARVPMPSLISIQVRLGTNGTRQGRRPLGSCSSASRAKPKSGCGWKGRGLLGYPGCDRSESGRTRNSARKSSASAARKRWKCSPARPNDGKSNPQRPPTPAPPCNPAWERVQLARHPKRPHCARLHPAAVHRLHGNPRRPRLRRRPRHRRAAWPSSRASPVMVIGQQKGRDTKQKLHPQLRHAQARRLSQGDARDGACRQVQAARSSPCSIRPAPIPGIDAEERGQAEAIADNLREMSRLPVPDHRCRHRRRRKRRRLGTRRWQSRLHDGERHLQRHLAGKLRGHHLAR